MRRDAIEILLPEKSYQRISADIERLDRSVSVVTWSKTGSSDGELRRAGRAVDLQEVAPALGWISADLFETNLLESYVGLLERLASIRWVQTAHAGLDHPCYRELAGRGVRVSKSGAQSIPITEYVLGYALDLFQGNRARAALQGEKRWQVTPSRELWRSQWLIVGYGHIGRGVARRARAFEANVVAVRRDAGQDPHADTVTTLADLPAHLPAADVVVLACPATAETRGLVDAAFLSRMKPDSVLINVARGSLVDEEALLRGLDEGRPGHAVLDVFQREPLPASSPLWSHPSVTVTAHTSNAGAGTRARGDGLFLDNLGRWLRGEPPVDEVPAAELLA